MLTLDLFEKWTDKYKRSIDCSHPKGFSQKAHCAGRKKHNESVEHNEPVFIQALRDFLPVALRVLNLDHVPKIVLKKELHDTNVPTFGRFTNEEKVVYCVINNRHPNDILRTLAHEMVHYAQGENHELSAGSWHTGSPIENEAHEKAGVIMRHFNTKFPKYLKAAPIMLPESANLNEGKINNAALVALLAGTLASQPAFSEPSAVANAIGIARQINNMKGYGPDAAKAEAHQELMNLIRAIGNQGDNHSKVYPLIKDMIKSPGPLPTTVEDLPPLVDQPTNENFADGKKPGRKGLAKRSGVDCKQSVTKLRDIASHSSGERQRMAHWCANMKAGKK
jgi:hypothetical protein